MSYAAGSSAAIALAMTPDKEKDAVATNALMSVAAPGMAAGAPDTTEIDADQTHESDDASGVVQPAHQAQPLPHRRRHAPGPLTKAIREIRNVTRRW